MVDFSIDLCIIIIGTYFTLQSDAALTAIELPKGAAMTYDDDGGWQKESGQSPAMRRREKCERYKSLLRRAINKYRKLKKHFSIIGRDGIPLHANDDVARSAFESILDLSRLHRSGRRRDS